MLLRREHSPELTARGRERAAIEPALDLDAGTPFAAPRQGIDTRLRSPATSANATRAP
jgi:hypothetical protein